MISNSRWNRLPQQTYRAVAGILGLLMLAVCLLVSGLFAVNVDRGLDITDESNAILMAQYSSQLNAGLTNYHDFTHIMWAIAGHRISMFRLLGLGIVVFTGLLVHFLIRANHRDSSATQGHRLTTIGEYSLFTLLALFYYHRWQMTPTYNWLAFVSGVWVLCGLLLYSSKSSTMRHDFSAALVVGIGGFFAFLAKPTSSAIYGIASLLYIGLADRPGKLKFCTTCAGIFFLATLAYILIGYHGLTTFVDEIQQSLGIAKKLGAGYTLPLLFANAAHDIAKFLPRLKIMILPAITCLVTIVTSRFVGRRFPAYRGYVAATGYSISMILMAFELYSHNEWLWMDLGSAGAMFLATQYFYLLGEKLLSPSVSRSRLPWIVLILPIFTIGYAFGSANGLILQLSGGVFFILAASYMASKYVDSLYENALPSWTTSALMLVLVLATVNHAYKHPQRFNAPISDQIAVTSLMGSSGSLKLEKGTARYVRKLKKIALQNGWTPGMNLIDLTGGSPGAMLILGAKFCGLPWLLGGYKGSSQYAIAVLGQVDKATLSNAWILTAPTGRLRARQPVYEALNINLQKNYIKVGTVISGLRRERQILWKPRPRRITTPLPK